MKKIINQPGQVVDQMLQGMVLAHNDKIYRVENTNVLALKEANQQVGVISGGGSGHEPSHAGFIGQGMLTAAACGEVFTSPSPDQVLEAIKAADTGKGVFLVIKNYTGDVMNFEMAQELAEMEDIQTAAIIVDDDIAIEDSSFTAGRRGVAGTVLMHKIIGYYASQGADLDKLSEIAQAVNDNLKTIGLALTAATVPEVGKPGFEISDDEFEYGVGIHGEPGYRREKMKSSQEMAEELVTKLKEDHNWQAGDHFAVLVNGLGSTPAMELYIFWQDVAQLLEKEELVVDFIKVDELMTALDMAGLSLTLLKITDSNWVKALKAPVDTIAWK